MPKLSDVVLQRELKKMPRWRKVGEAIQKKYRFRSFKNAMRFVNRVGRMAERAGHHPDISISYSLVILRVWTHSEGGVTGKDIDLARTIDASRRR